MDSTLLVPVLVLVVIAWFIAIVSRWRSRDPPRPPLPPPLCKTRLPVGDRPMPRGAIVLSPSLQTPDRDWWRRDKAAVMADAGGADRFWAACKVPLDASSPVCMGPDGYPVQIGRIVDDDGTIRYGQFTVYDGHDCQLGGYGVVKRTDGTTIEGFWEDDTLCGQARTLWPSGRIETGYYMGEGKPFGRFWWADPDGRHGYVDQWPDATCYERDYDYGNASIELASGVRQTLSMVDSRYPVGVEMRFFDRKRINWPNGDYVVIERSDDWVLNVIAYGMANDTGHITIDEQRWTVEKRQPSSDRDYDDDYVYAPSDTDSPAFALWTHYILSGRSARPGGYTAEQQTDFVALVTRLLAGREPCVIACPFVHESGAADSVFATNVVDTTGIKDVDGDGDDDGDGNDDIVNLPDTLVGVYGKAWTRLQDEAIRRCGGPLAFALACEIDLDRSTVQHWSEDAIKVAVGRRRLDDGTILRGEFDAKTRNLHGYGVAVHPDGSVRQGEWTDGTLDGIAITRDSNGYTGIGIYLDDLPNGRFFYKGHGANIAIDHWLPYEKVASDGSTDDSWFDRRWPNGDHANERWHDGRLFGVSFAISPAACPGSLLTGACIEAINWRICKHEPTPDCPFDGYTYVPADTTSPEFALFSAYILSGRSAHNGFCAARQQAFVAAITDALSQHN
ncbi:hypothetical protein pmac_cds_212 [Pandoravirus macleodensis]|uniref:DUF5900 domain-containing protein n=1 Tax=Pandoravirus macleodensis TaxID=2107707 RepID=A0A2U7UF29_9VIRU|nr:hypothetical protein pmac_cds_212 [Pandoravirus macleodensis]AVK76900.1 hypothetical protein pmac_cds_212 [Pandoravirus macleodensis]